MWGIILASGVFLATSGLAIAQGDSITARPDAVFPLPTVNLVFSDSKSDSPIPLPSSVMSGGPKCSSDGRAFVQVMTPPPLYTYRVIYSITSDGQLTHYTTEQIDGLIHTTVIAFDPGLSGPVMLLRARPAGQSGQSGAGFYLVRFRNNGELRGYSRLDLGFEIANIAQLTDDSYLVMGAERETGKIRIVVIDENGKFVREIELKSIMPTDGKMDQMITSMNIVNMNVQEMPPGMKSYAEMGMFQSVHSSEGLLLFIPGAETSVIKLLRTGEITSVRLSLPHNEIADSIIGTSGHWYMRAYNPNADRDWALYEVDADTGRTLRRIDTQGVPATSIACQTQSGFYGFRWIEKKPFLISGSLQ
jgi:hypothetical protein